MRTADHIYTDTRIKLCQKALLAFIFKTQKWCIDLSKLCKPRNAANFYNLRYGMRIKITKSLVLEQMQEIKTIPEVLFLEGEYLANLTPEGKIEVINTSKIKVLFSLSQFREKLTLGEFVVVES